ncbi:hypothetical protein OLQ22_04085 [Campylobacter jejuni]|nr:hypothetical protein [Campylobacter jejuni]
MVKIISLILCLLFLNACKSDAKNLEQNTTNLEQNATKLEQNSSKSINLTPQNKEELILLLKENKGLYLGDINTSKITDMSDLFAEVFAKNWKRSISIIILE